MSMQKPIHWINNQTRLNAQNMNTIGAALDDIGQQLYGETYDNSGLINTVSIHSGWFTGDTGGDKKPNSGLFTQMEQVGKALLCPSFSCVSSGKWASGGYDYKTITNHKTILPKIEAIGTWGNTPTAFTASEKVEICLDDGNTLLCFSTNDTVKLRPGKYYYEIKLVDIDSQDSYTVKTIVSKTLFWIVD